MRPFRTEDRERDESIRAEEPKSYTIVGYYHSYSENTLTNTPDPANALKTVHGQGAAVTVMLGAFNGVSFTLAAIAAGLLSVAF